MADDITIIPPDDSAPDADSELEAVNDAADLVLDDDVVLTSDPPPPVGRSWAFDFVEAHFEQGAGHGPIQTNGDATLTYWVEKCLRTARGAHPVYNLEFGMPDPYFYIGRRLTSADHAQLEADITESLTFHPRIVGIEDFSAFQDPDDDALVVSFTYIKDDATAIPVNGLPIG